VKGDWLVAPSFAEAQKFGRLEMLIPGPGPASSCTKACAEGRGDEADGWPNAAVSRTVVIARGRAFRRPTVPA